jgi:hypothetical protein
LTELAFQTPNPRIEGQPGSVPTPPEASVHVVGEGRGEPTAHGNDLGGPQDVAAFVKAAERGRDIPGWPSILGFGVWNTNSVNSNTPLRAPNR